MHYKKLPILPKIVMAAFLLLFCACQKHEENHLFVSCDSMFISNGQTLYFDITTDAKSECQFEITSMPEWLRIRPLIGWVQAGNAAHLAATTLFDYFDSNNIHYGTISITSDVENVTIEVVGVANPDVIFSVSDTLVYPNGINVQTLKVTNNSELTLPYSITTSSNAISVESDHGEVPPHGQADIQVEIDREAIIDGFISPTLDVTVNEIVKTVSFEIERKRLLPAEVIDAEYSKTRDVLAYVTDKRTLNVYHPDTKNTDVIQLRYRPTCLSLSLDGNYAAVGFDKHVTYVDLLTCETLTTNNISCMASDIVLGNNHWAYVVPDSDMLQEIQYLDVSTPNSTVYHLAGIKARSKARLHPSGKYIYCAVYGSRPTQIKKFDIQNDTIVFMYDSPSLNTPPFSDDFWYSEDGNKIFNKGGAVIRATEDQATDMHKIGSFGYFYTNVATRIFYVDHSEIKRQIYSIYQLNNGFPNDPYIYVNSSEDYTMKSYIALEKYMMLNNGNLVTRYETEPYFVFTDSQGDIIYVITKSAAADTQWALETIPIQ